LTVLKGNNYFCAKPNNMIKTKILAYPGAPETLLSEGKEKLNNFFQDIEFNYNAHNPEALVFLSGGSENEAIQHINTDKFILLLAFEENNSWASAAEVKAWMDKRNTGGMLIDLYERDDRKKAHLYFDAIEKLQKLQGQKLGQIGNVSEWLVASTIEHNLLYSKLGIEIIKIPWSSVPDYMDSSCEKDFEDKYASISGFDIVSASKVHTVLQSVIDQHALDAITVECFSLVKDNGVTACLSLSHLNDLGVPAGCEGDITSIIGIMLVQALTGRIPWMANTIKVNTNKIKFTHCTAPTNLLEGFEIDTHYETGLGTAVSGKIAKGPVTVFRLNNTLDQAFLAEGNVIQTSKVKHACRTQVEVEISETMAKQLKTHPLGNHHLVLPGKHKESLEAVCKVLGITTNNHQFVGILRQTP